MADRRPVDPGRFVPAAQLGLAALALSIGLLVYLLDRPAGHAALIPAAWAAARGGASFGAAAAWLPSFLHVFAFSLLTAATLPHSPAAAAGSCVLWWGIGLGFEVLQHPAIARPFAAALDGLPGFRTLARFALQGRFDPADIAALSAGACAAAALLFLFMPREVRHET